MRSSVKTSSCQRETTLLMFHLMQRAFPSPAPAIPVRMEMCYPLNGSDLSPERNPIEAGLGFFVDLAKPDFVGRDALLKTKEFGPREKLVPFRMKAKGRPPRPHYAVFRNGARIGEVTSGTLSPSLNWGIGMAYV